MMNGNSSTPQWKVYDGTGNANKRDYDGSLIGLLHTHIVQDRPFFTGRWKRRKIAGIPEKTCVVSEEFFFFYKRKLLEYVVSDLKFETN